MEDAEPQGDPVLLSHRHMLQILCRSISAFSSEIKNNAYQPPILDLNTDYSEPEVAGLTKFEGLCAKELAHHEYLLKTNRCADNVSSNTPFLLAVWKEVLSAPKPVIALSPSVKPAIDQPAFKFDVISANGNRWHKINTVKVSRILAELQEGEIGPTEDYTRLEQSDSKWRHITVVRQCLDMRIAAKSCTTGPENTPSLSYRLSRLDEAYEDRRIQTLYQIIRDLDVDLQFGDPEDSSQDSALPGASKQTILSLDLNLDLSLLVALLSDITHADLPESHAEAEARYQPVARLWKRTTSRVDGHLIEDRPALEGEMGAEEHTRALTMQLRQEMRSGLVDELSQAIRTMCEMRGISPEHVRFWTTREAMERCFDIARKIAGPREAYRAKHMFGDKRPDDEISLFWLGSRHQPVLQPMRTFAVGLLEDASESHVAVHSPRSFAGRMESTCRRILGDHATENVAKDPLGLFRGRSRRHDKTSPTAPKVPSMHTTRSMLAGVTRGMTTVTANRMSVKQIVRNMGLQGLQEEGDLASFLVVEPKTLAEQKRADGFSNTNDNNNDVKVRVAALLITEPRSLSETFQNDALVDFS